MNQTIRGWPLDKDGKMTKKNHLLLYGVFVIILLLVGAISLELRAQNIKFERLSVADGLSQNTVYCILRDNRGFMWFGTQHGLNRYDGHTFKLFEHDPRSSNSLSNNLVISILEDKDGVLWVGTWGGGLNKFDRKTEHFEVYKKNPETPGGLSDDNVRVIYQDGFGVIWVGSDNGLDRVSKDKTTFGQARTKNGVISVRVNTIYEDRIGALWVGADDGLYKFDRKNNLFSPCKKKTDSSTLKKIKVICEDTGGILWIGTEGGLYQFDRKKEKINYCPEITDNPDNLAASNVSSLLEDKFGRLWVGTQAHGVYLSGKNKKGFTPYPTNPGTPYSLSHNDVRSIYQDKETGLIWIGTNGGGIDKFDPNWEKFTLYRNAPDDHNSLSDNDVMTIFESKQNPGKVWLGTRGGGISLFDPKKGDFSHHKIPRYVSDSPNRNDARAIWEDHAGELWVGTERAGLFHFDPKTGVFRHHNYTPVIGEDEYILAIYETIDKILWIGTMGGGLIRIDKDRKNAVAFKSDSGNPNSIPDNKIFSIFEDKTGLLWIGTGSGGLVKFDRKLNTFSPFQANPPNISGISHNFITEIYEGRNGTLWIGTSGGGLNKFDRISNSFTVYTVEEGLPNNVIYDILEDEKGFLWLSTNKGLSRFDPRNETSRNFSVSDNLQGDEFNRGAACRIKKGLMIFGGTNGLNIFNPAKIEDISIPPKMVITSFRKFSPKGWEEASVFDTTQLELSYRDSSISFEFAALDYSDPESNRYAYKLEPVDKSWIELGNKHDITFPKIKPGDYQLKIKGANNEGVWCEVKDEISIMIKVTSPFWETWWFLASAILLIGINIATLVSLRIKRVEKQKKEINEAYKEKENAYNKLQKETVERKRIVKALQESEELYRALVETSPEAIVLCDTQKQIVMTNRQTALLLGYESEEEMRSEINTFSDVFNRKDRYKAVKEADFVLPRAFDGNVETLVQAKDGTFIPVEIIASKIEGADGFPKYILALIRDIRRRKEAERQEKLHQKKLVQFDKMVSLGNMVSGVAHELNNPANIIMVNAENFSDVWSNVKPILDHYAQEDDDLIIAGVPYEEVKDDIGELIDGLLDSSKRIRDIIEDLKSFSRPESMALRPGVEINKVINSAIRLTNSTIKISTTNFSKKFADQIPTILGSVQKLQQVFINLIENACQALPDRKRGIIISTSFDKINEQVVVKVKDHGRGIAPKHMKFITDPFYTTKRSTGGTGLGLFISFRIVQEHGGFMKFESEVGEGTTVHVHFPIKLPGKKSNF